MSAHHKEYSSLRNEDALNGRNEQARADTAARIGSANLAAAITRLLIKMDREARQRA